MKKLTYYKCKKIESNLLELFDKASNLDIIEGKKWYFEANLFCKEVAKQYKSDVYTVASVLSALSPHNKWEQNKKDCIKVFDAVNKYLKPDQIKVCTFNSNKIKAFNIAKGEQIITNNSLKTFNFLNNIAYLCGESLTVDVWHLRACFNKSIKINNATIGVLAYNQIKDITIKLANQLNLKSYELQAVIWLVIQREYKKK